MTAFSLPPRVGHGPQTRPAIPHQQLDQNAPVEIQELLWKRMSGLDHVWTGSSVISLPDSRAVHLDKGHAQGPAGAFFPGSTEFAHLHGAADGSLHLLLSEQDAAVAIDAGWAEFHPAVLAGRFPPVLVMVYGPRDADDLETVWRIVERAYQHAAGRS
jgi:hypothetical protein